MSQLDSASPWGTPILSTRSLDTHPLPNPHEVQRPGAGVTFARTRSGTCHIAYAPRHLQSRLPPARPVSTMKLGLRDRPLHSDTARNMASKGSQPIRLSAPQASEVAQEMQTPLQREFVLTKGESMGVKIRVNPATLGSDPEARQARGEVETRPT